jgi:hypothetical protein
MNYIDYSRERDRLLEVLSDAEDRGDYHLEFDVKELLQRLEDDYDEEN